MRTTNEVLQWYLTIRAASSILHGEGIKENLRGDLGRLMKKSLARDLALYIYGDTLTHVSL